MPRRSDEHLQMRRDQVLLAALRCFSREGFHATTMQDVVRESGLSAGAVYRYFPGKNQLVLAGASTIDERAAELMEQLVHAPDPVSPPVALRTLLSGLLETSLRDDLDLTRVAVSAWAEALRDPEVLEVARNIFTPLREGFREIVIRWRDAGHLPADTDPDAPARVLMSLMPGFVLQRLVLGEVDPDTFDRGLSALMGLDPSPITQEGRDPA